MLRGSARSNGTGYKMNKKKKHNTKQKNKQNEVTTKQNITEVVEEVVENVADTAEEIVESIADKAEEVVESMSDAVEEKVESKVKNMINIEKLTNLWKAFIKRAKNTSKESYKTLALAGLKIVLPVIALIIVIATIVSLVQVKNKKQEEDAVVMTEMSTESVVMLEALEMDAYPDVNEKIVSYYKALALGDMDTVALHRDNISETDLLQLKIKSDFVEGYYNINCYTRNSIEENAYFAYVTYETKFNGFETMVPGVMTHYVYKAEDGSFKIAEVYKTEDGGLAIDKENDGSINVALMESSCQDDVVDIFNKIDVDYKEVLATNEELTQFLTEMSAQIKTKMGEEIAKLEVGETIQEEPVEVAAISETEVVANEQPQTQIVDEEVKATTTVNVRSSDSENADKIGRLESGKTVKRIENKINGWSKIIFDGKEAYVKSDYLGLISSTPVEQPADAPSEETNQTETSEVATTETKKEGSVTATTNVNVRNKPSTSADTIGKANGGSSYKLIEDQGEWLKIEYKGQTGFVKAEYFN